MYKEHPAFSPPPDNAVLWRYMDFAKFVFLLDKNALYFVRADKLGDPFEGAFPVKNRELNFRAFHEAYNEPMNADAFRGIREGQKLLRHSMLISCWHQSDHESAAMWNLYASKKYGIAIKTDFSSFKQSLITTKDIYIGKVNYINYASDVLPETNAFYPFLHKRQDFKYEQEVRAIIWAIPEVGGLTRAICEIGKYYIVDLSFLIKEVIVAPNTDDRSLEHIQSVMDRYKLKAPVIRSSLADQPMWY